MVLDGSKDGSAEIAYEFVEQYPDTFRIIYKANGGHGSAINTGLMMASGEYVKILDSDDWVERMLSVGWWTALKRKGRSLQAGRKIDENCYYVDVESVMYPITEVEPSLSGTGSIKQGIQKSRIVLYSFYSDFSTLTSRELSSGIIIQNRTNSPSRHWKEEQSRIIMPCLMQASNTS